MQLRAGRQDGSLWEARSVRGERGQLFGGSVTCTTHYDLLTLVAVGIERKVRTTPISITSGGCRGLSRAGRWVWSADGVVSAWKRVDKESSDSVLVAPRPLGLRRQRVSALPHRVVFQRGGLGGREAATGHSVHVEPLPDWSVGALQEVKVSRGGARSLVK